MRALIWTLLTLFSSQVISAKDNPLGSFTLRGTITDLKYPEKNVAIIRADDEEKGYVLKIGDAQIGSLKFKITKITNKSVELVIGKEAPIEIFTSKALAEDEEVLDDLADHQTEELDDAVSDFEDDEEEYYEEEDFIEEAASY